MVQNLDVKSVVIISAFRVHTLPFPTGCSFAFLFWGIQKELIWKCCLSISAIVSLKSYTSLYYDWSKWLSETRHLILSFLPTILAYLPWAQGIINITQEPALSFFKSFPWKCSTPLNGPANAVAVMFWTAALLQDKLSCAMCLSVDFLAQRLRGHECQLVTAIWKSLINFFTSRRWLLLKCHLPSFHP